MTSHSEAHPEHPLVASSWPRISRPRFFLTSAGRLSAATLGFGLASAGALACIGPIQGSELVAAVPTFLIVVASLIASVLALEQAPRAALALAIALPFIGFVFAGGMLVVSAAGAGLGVSLLAAALFAFVLAAWKSPAPSLTR